MKHRDPHHGAAPANKPADKPLPKKAGKAAGGQGLRPAEFPAGKVAPETSGRAPRVPARGGVPACLLPVLFSTIPWDAVGGQFRTRWGGFVTISSWDAGGLWNRAWPASPRCISALKSLGEVGSSRGPHPRLPSHHASSDARQIVRKSAGDCANPHLSRYTIVSDYRRWMPRRGMARIAG